MFRNAIPAALLALCSTAGIAQTLPAMLPLPPLISGNGLLGGAVPPIGAPIAFLMNTGNAVVPVLLGRLALPTTVAPSAAPGFSLPSLPPGTAGAMGPF